MLSRVTQINRASAITEAALPIKSFFAGYKLSDYVNPQNRILAGPRSGAAAAPYMAIYGLPSGNYRGRYFNNLGATASSAQAVSLPNWGAYQDFRVLRLGIRFIF